MTTKAPSSQHQQDAGDTASRPIHLIFGGDEFAVSKCAREIVDKLCPPGEQALGLEIVEGSCETIDAAVAAIDKCLDAVRTVGFLGAGKVVWMRDVSFLSDAKPGKFVDVRKRLEALTAEIKGGLVAGQLLVISSPKVDKRSAFYKACQATADVKEFALPEKTNQMEQQARTFLADTFRQAGLSVGEDAFDLFLERCGIDSRQIVQEVEKLRTYLGERRQVGSEDVQAVVSASREAIGWDLADAIGKRDLPRALRVLRQLLFQKEVPVGLLFGVESRMRELIVFHDCMERGWLQRSGNERYSEVRWNVPPDADALLSALGSDPRKIHPFRAALLAAQAVRFTKQDLVRCHGIAVETHERVVTSSGPPELLLELMLIKMLVQESHARKKTNIPSPRT